MMPICVIFFLVVFRFPARGHQTESLLDVPSTTALMGQRNVQNSVVLNITRIGCSAEDAPCLIPVPYPGIF